MGNKTNGRDIQQEQRDDEIPACQSCRRKKARCSREQPCSQCVRAGTACTYDEKRMKPGLRSGVVDSLSRRIETLENMFLGQEILWKQMWETLHPGAKFPGPDDINPGCVPGVQQTLRRSLLQVASQEENEPPTKRRRTQSPAADESLSLSAADIIESDLLGRLVEFYFDNFHHWIPILHVRRFRHQIQSTEGRREATHTLYAIIAACIRFINDPRLADKEMVSRVAESCRQKVLLSGMESFSVGNLQALVIVAFDTIARGRGPSSWSIVGGMARTVEQLQLSIEEDHLYDQGQAGETLIRRMAFLKPSTCWREAEERRRVFWTVFLMDRFCSVSTGWNISLTTADVKRRLPCEGALWQNEDEVRAPYFGSSSTKGMSQHQPLLLDRQLTKDPAEQDSIGGFAYCIEATESLALVSNFFVHQPLDVRNVEETQVWLMRFKELDLRLVQWKLFLPSKWRDASKLNADGIMDSNLTLAHMTHNTVVILLHQAIAYPPHHWKSSPVKLHSSSSAETCIEAASEISAIGSQFLLCSSMLTNPQFSFCLFIAGRMLLTHARYNNVSIPPALDTLIANLLEISTRWAGPRDLSSPEKENLASGFAKRLVHARDNLPPTARSLDIRQPVYSETAATEERIPTQESATGSQTPSGAIAPSLHQMPAGLSIDNMQGVQENSLYTDFHDTNSDSSLTLAFPPLPLSFQHSFAPFTDPEQFNPHLDPGESLATMPSTVRNQADSSLSWNGVPVPFYPPVQDSHDTVSAGSGHIPSPGQRTSQFQAAEQGGSHRV